MKVQTPRLLEVYNALCELSPKGYDVLARIILSTANAERHRDRERARRRARIRGGNICRPVITIDDDGKPAA